MPDSVPGKYQLIARIGQGGMAQVFLALVSGALGFSKLAVVKRLRTALQDGDEKDSLVSMFLDEARLAARLNHPNVVHTYEVGEHDGIYFLAMEYIEGQSLKSLFNGAKNAAPSLDQWPVNLWLQIVIDILDGLHYAHELSDFDGTALRIVHRDVSPQNIVISYDGTAKLLDFGVAKAALNNTATEAGVIKGKASYMAPEQLLGLDVNRRADIFSIGIVLWELLTKERLFGGDTTAAIYKLLSAPIPPVTQYDPELRPKLAAIVGKALDRDVDKRFQTAAEMRDALTCYLRQAGESARKEDIAQFMTKLFGEQRATMQARIQAYCAAATDRRQSDAYLAASESSISLTRELPVLTRDDDREGSGSKSWQVAMAKTTSGFSASEPGLSKNGPPKSVFVALAVGILIVLSAIAFRLVGTASGSEATVAAAQVSSQVDRSAGTAPSSAGPMPQKQLAVVILSTAPKGAAVEQDGKHLGETPIRIELPAGVYSFGFSRKGYTSQNLSVSVPEGVREPIERSVSLEPQSAAKRAPASASVRAKVPKTSAPPPVTANINALDDRPANVTVLQ